MISNKRSLIYSHLLCLVIVFSVSWPALKTPRLEADDYRYLHRIQQVSSSGSSGICEAFIVENRWDHLWFMNEEGRVRFFRPTVVLSYAMDWKVWGDHYAFGLTLTNILIHLGCSLLVGYLLFRWLGPGLVSILSAALFAGLWAHGECIWYIAGRTDSLAALGFLAAVTLHLAGDDRAALRWWAIPFFIVGFLTKEMVIAAPLVLITHDLFISKRRVDWKLYTFYGAAVVGILLIKKWALSGNGSDFVYPYLVSPLTPEFIEHLWLQIRSYSGNLLFAEWTVPFADAETIAAMNRLTAPFLAVLLIAGSGVLLRRDKRFWVFLLLGGVTWLPTSFVYLSERYLYLPSIAFVALIGLFISTRSGKWQVPLVVLLGVYATFHAIKLHSKHMEVCSQPGSIDELAEQIESIQGKIKKGGRLLLINEPGLFVRAQFSREMLCILLNDPDLTVDVLTMMPGQNGTEWKPGDPLPLMGAGVQLFRTGTHKFNLQGQTIPPAQRAQRIQEYGLKRFAWSELAMGKTYRTTTGLEAHVLKADGIGATAIEFNVPEPLEDYQVLVWEADGHDLNEHPWTRRKKARVRLATEIFDTL